MNSRVYQISSNTNDAYAALDPKMLLARQRAPARFRAS